MAENTEEQSGKPHKKPWDWHPLLDRLVITLVVGAVLVIASILDDLWPAPEALVSVTELTSTDGQHQLYLRRKVTGTTFDADVTVISMSSLSDIPIDSTREYVFHQSTKLLYRFRNDTLTVYPPEDTAAVPPQFVSPITVVQEVVPGLRYLSISDSVGLGGIAEVCYPRHESKGN